MTSAVAVPLALRGRVDAVLSKRWAPPMVAVAMFLVAFWPRFQVVTDEHPPGLYLVSDMAIYRERAIRLLDGPLDVHDTFTPVGYPALMAAIFKFFGRNDAFVGLAQALMGAATCVLAAWLAHHWAGRAAAFVAFVATAFYAPLVLYTSVFLTETTSAFLVTLSTVLLTIALTRRRSSLGAFAGLALAASAIVRPNLLLVFPLLAGLAWLLRRDRGASRALVVALFVSLIPMGLVSAHNTRLAGRFVSLGSNGGVNFYLAHAEIRALEFPEGGPIAAISPYRNRTRFTRLERTSHAPEDEAYFYRAGLALFRDEPKRILGAMGHVVDGVGLGPMTHRPGSPYWPGWRERDEELIVWARAMFFLGIVPPIVHSFVLGRRRELVRPEQAARLVALCMFASGMLAMAVFLGDPRLRVSFDALLIALGAAAWVRFAAWATRKARAPERSGGALS